MASASATSVVTVAEKLVVTDPSVFDAVTVTVATPSMAGVTVTCAPARDTLTASPVPSAPNTSALPLKYWARSTVAGAPPTTSETSGTAPTAPGATSRTVTWNIW